MASTFDQETNNEYHGEDVDDLDDFIVDDYDDLDGFIVDDDPPLKKQKPHQQQDEEEEGEGQEGEEEEFDDEEEEEEAPAGQQEILSLREQLKAEIRRKNAAISAVGVAGKAASSSPVRQPTLPVKDRFGTFFGPSRPALARRVIQEGCSSMMKELQNTPSTRHAPLASKAQSAASESLQRPKFISEEKRKVDTLRENRDYSSLFSDDPESPPPAMEQSGNGPALVRKAEDVDVREPLNSSKKGRVSTGQPNSVGDHGSKGTAPSIQAGVRRKAPSPLPGKQSRNGAVSPGKNGSNLPTMRKATGLQPSLESKRPQATHPGQRQPQASRSPGQKSNGRQLLQNRRPEKSVQGQRSEQNGSAAEPHGRPRGPAQKQLDPSSKLKASRPVEKRVVKRKKSADGYTGSGISSMIRGIFGYNPDKYVGRDDDDRAMEADYATILEEERRSAILAKKEDEEELRQIVEEERRDREKKRKKPSGTKSD